MKMTWKSAVEKALLGMAAPHVVTTQDIEAYAMTSQGFRPPASSLVRLVRSLVETGALQPVSKGVFLNRLAGPAVHPAEAAQYIRRGAIVSLAWVLERSGALNNFGDTVTCVVPQLSGSAPPKVGERDTAAGPFRFYAMPARLVEGGSFRLEDIQDLRYGYPRATPERALLDWIYLGTSVRSRLPLPPLDIQLRGMNQPRLTRLAKAMGMSKNWQDWYARWKAREEASDIEDRTAVALGF